MPLMTHGKATAKNFAYSSEKPKINETEGALQRRWALAGERLRSTVAQFMQYEGLCRDAPLMGRRTLF